MTSIRRGALLFTVLAIAASAQTAKQQTKQPIRLVAKGDSLFVVNLDPARKILAIHLEDATRQRNGLNAGLTEMDVPIYPGLQIELKASGNYFVDGVLFEDRTVYGPNRFGLDAHYQMREAIRRGGPAYPSDNDYTHGDSKQYARRGARQFKMAKPQLGGEDVNMIYSPGFVAIGYFDNVMTTTSFGEDGYCEQSYLVYGLIMETTVCSGDGDCTVSGDAPYAEEEAFSDCPGVVISTLSELEDPNTYQSTIMAEGLLNYDHGVTLDQYNFASCNAPEYISPRIVILCGGSNN